MTIADLTVSKREASIGEMGQKLLISGDQISMRLWEEQPGDGKDKSMAARGYETVGYVLEGKAELRLEDKNIPLKPGVSWIVPQAAEHSYKILEPFRAIEATHPPARGYSSGL
ncbi:MAG: cupin domain-containing protein [Phormidesmis sp.]